MRLLLLLLLLLTAIKSSIDFLAPDHSGGDRVRQRRVAGSQVERGFMK